MTQEKRLEIKKKVEQRAYRQEGQGAKESLKGGEAPVVIIGVSRNGDPVIAMESEEVRLFNQQKLPKGKRRPNTRFGPR